jgi:type II secretion system protein G
MGRAVLNYESPTYRERSDSWKVLRWIGCATAGLLFLLFAIAMFPIPRDRAREAKTAAAKTDLATIRVAVAQFQFDMGRLPTPAEGLDVLIDAPADAPGKWHGPYLPKLPSDPWGQPYVYHQPGDRSGAPFNVISFGPDKHPGGGDDITD